MKTRLIKLQEWWGNLAQRERRAIAIGGAFLAIYIVYQWMWVPYLDMLTTMRRRIETEQDVLRVIQETNQTIQAVEKQAQTKGPPLTPVVVLTSLQRAINQAGLRPNLRELKQISSESIGLRFSNVEFDKLIKLLANVVKEQRLTITQMSATATGSELGIVNANIELGLS